MEVIRALYFFTLLGLSVLILQQMQIFFNQLMNKTPLQQKFVKLSLNEPLIVHNIDDKFVGVTLASHIFPYLHKRHSKSKFTFSSIKMKTLAKGLAPSYLRVGGTQCDFLIFNMTTDTTLRYESIMEPKRTYVDLIDGQTKAFKNFTMTPDDWDQLNIFCEESGWNLIFDFNVFLRKNGQWDPSNAIELLKYTIEKGYKPAGYELGNEPDLFPGQFPDQVISGETLAKDYDTFKSILMHFNLQPFLTIGPDTAGVYRKFFEVFLESGGGETVDVATFHHYYLNSKTATIDQFHDPKVLDTLISQVKEAVNICRTDAPNKQCWLGETSSAYGGGASGLSDRYVAGYLWLDKLGISALNGLDGVVRQSFYGGNYGLINNNLDPNPDYFTTVLYKRLVGRQVLNITKSTNPNLRAYAHCAYINGNMGYGSGDVTIYVMNLAQDSIILDITGITSSSTKHIYLLSPGDDQGLESHFIALNGQMLQMPSESELPIFKPVIQVGGNIELPGWNMGFIVLPGAGLPQCL